MARIGRRGAARAGTALAAALIALGMLSGCSEQGNGQPSGAAQQPLPETPAAEPGSGPDPAAVPEGRIIQLPGGSPEGAVMDPSNSTLAAALREPDRLALVNTDTEAVRAVPAPGAARHLSLAGPGELLVSGEDTNTLSRVRLPAGNVTGETKVGKAPHDAARVADKVFVSNEFGHSVGIVQNGRMIREIHSGLVQPGGLTATAGRVAVVDVRTNTLHIIDAATSQQVATLPAGKGPSHVRPIGDGRVAVADTRGNAVFSYQITGTPRQLGRTQVPGRAYGLDTDPSRGYVYTTSGNNKVFRLRVADNGTLTEPRALDTVRRPNDVTVDPEAGTVYVIGQNKAQVQVLSPQTFDRP